MAVKILAAAALAAALVSTPALTVPVLDGRPTEPPPQNAIMMMALLSVYQTQCHAGEPANEDMLARIRLFVLASKLDLKATQTQTNLMAAIALVTSSVHQLGDSQAWCAWCEAVVRDRESRTETNYKMRAESADAIGDMTQEVRAGQHFAGVSYDELVASEAGEIALDYDTGAGTVVL